MRTGELELLVALARRPARRVPRLAGSTEADVGDRGRRVHGPVDGLLPQARRSRSCGSSCWSARRSASGPRGATAAGCRASSRAPPAATSAPRSRLGLRRCSGRCSRPSRRSASVVEREQIDADLVLGGQLDGGARRARRQARLREHVAAARVARARRGRTCAMLAPQELAARVRVAGASAASFSPHVARVHPAKLVRGLARAVEAPRRARSTSARP